MNENFLKSSIQQEMERENLPRRNHRGILYGKLRTPKRFRKSKTRGQVFTRLFSANDHPYELNSATQKRRTPCQPL